MFTEKIQLEEDETILTTVRKHWFVHLLQMARVVVVALFPLFAFLVLTTTSISVQLDMGAYMPHAVALYCSWLILCWMAGFAVWTNYYLDVWTVTNKRLVTVDQRGLFNRETGSFRLERLQDINVSVRGILGTLLKYGDLNAETASEDRSFVARGIPDPQALKALILKASDTVTFNRVSGPTNGTQV